MTSLPSNWITSEIQQMMFGFGDGRRPSEETAILVAEIVHQHMMSIMHQALAVAAMRGEKSIGIEDILFLMRKDKVKLKRLLQYYEVRDLKNKTLAQASGDDSSKLDHLGFERRVMGKNRSICYEFLSTIDQTGELLALFEDREPDVVKHERLVRAELQSRGMDTQQYMEFCLARQANFCRKYNKSQRFRDWLFPKDGPEGNLTPSVVEIFSYLAFECVAQIVDLALLVKQDKRAHSGDPSDRCKPPLSINYAELQASSIHNKADILADSQSSLADVPSQLSAHLAATTAASATAQAVSAALGRAGIKKKRKKSGPPSTVEMSWDTQILPSDVREALRRYYTDIGPFASSRKVMSHNSSWHKTLVN